jgi:hypothetical protein
MRYELTVTIQLDSGRDQDRVAKLFESLFEFGTIKESMAEGLQLLNAPRLLAVAVKGKASDPTTGSAAWAAAHPRRKTPSRPPLRKPLKEKPLRFDSATPLIDTIRQ